jgi:hypothetical protein
MNHRFVRLTSVLLGAIALIAAYAVYAAGTTQRERTMSRYNNCEWTEAMSKEVYECVVRNNGFSSHWCFDETVQMNCEPESLETAGKDSGVSQK